MVGKEKRLVRKPSRSVVDWSEPPSNIFMEFLLDQLASWRTCVAHTLHHTHNHTHHHHHHQYPAANFLRMQDNYHGSFSPRSVRVYMYVLGCSCVRQRKLHHLSPSCVCVCVCVCVCSPSLLTTFFSLSLSHTLTLSLALSHTHTLSLTHTLYLSLTF